MESTFIKYICPACGYEYDPAVGDPDSGISPGTAFEDIPDDWVCPDCGVGKEDFEAVVSKEQSGPSDQASDQRKKIVIIGSGIAGVTLAEDLVKDGRFEVHILTAEIWGYYSRPQLSQGFSKADRNIVLKSFEALMESGIQVHKAVQVKSIVPNQKQVLAVQEEKEVSFAYDQLVLATGSAAFVPPPLRKFEGKFEVLNGLGDLKKLQRLRDQASDQKKTMGWAIIGGGLIGCEVASDLVKAGDQVSIFHLMDRLMERQFTEEQSTRLFEYFQTRGVKLILERGMDEIKGAGPYTLAEKSQEMNDQYDVVLVATGFLPRIDLIKSAGGEVDRGIVVNGKFETSIDSVYAVGDGAQVDGQVHPFIVPVQSQAKHLAKLLRGQTDQQWSKPDYKLIYKIHDFSI